ncbi:S8 family serine peptidase [Aquimarina sp. 2201CG1-2-11]|uniref:S8 family serine peptidase n=1 Tax=Aquimarina discodermiae TaxID=3231043 RepID=UPI0034637B9F
MKKLILFTLILFVGISFVHSQSEQAWVFFNKKEKVYESIYNPRTILTPKAIKRKYKNYVYIDKRDVPVSESFIKQIKESPGITVLAKSKWFNCVFVEGGIENIRDLTSLDFVDRVDFADNSLDNGGKKSKAGYQKKATRKSKNKIEPMMDFDYGKGTQQIRQINADFLHEQNFTGKGMTIAVIDSGFQGSDTIMAFEKLRAEKRLLGVYDFTNRAEDSVFTNGGSHGTRVLSAMASNIEDQLIGTAPDASYYLFSSEILDIEEPLEEALWVEAVERADSLGVDVINTSLGYGGIPYDNPAYAYSTSDMDGKTTFISRGANIAFEKGMLVVVAAGNSGDVEWKIISAPADAPGVFTVGAVDLNDDYAFFSSTGPTADGRVKPDVMAKGFAATVIRSDGSVNEFSFGTSFSSPIMAGAVTCLWQSLPYLTNKEIMQLVRESASHYKKPNNEMGYGIPDFEKILRWFGYGWDRYPVNKDGNIVSEIRTYPNPVVNELYFDLIDKSSVEVKIYTTERKMVKSATLENTKNKISLNGLSNGLYIVDMISDNKRQTNMILKK